MNVQECANAMKKNTVDGCAPIIGGSSTVSLRVQDETGCGARESDWRVDNLRRCVIVAAQSLSDWLWVETIFVVSKAPLVLLFYVCHFFDRDCVNVILHISYPSATKHRPAPPTCLFGLEARVPPKDGVCSNGGVEATDNDACAAILEALSQSEVTSRAGFHFLPTYPR